MHEDQVWPQRSDFGAAGGFQELGLRLRDVGFFTALALALVIARDPYFFNLNLSEWGLRFLGCLVGAGLLAWLIFPSRKQLRSEFRLAGGPVSQPPRLAHQGNLLSPRPERRDLWACLLVVLLSTATGLLANLPLLLAFAPLIVFRLASRLWTEVDLVGGKVFYHRTFLGLQITRLGPGLERAEGLVSGVRLDRPGEDNAYAVCMILPDHQTVPLETMCRTRDESHELGRRLGLQLNLPHAPLDTDPSIQHVHGESLLRGRGGWKPIEGGGCRGSRRKLPPVAEDQP